MSASILERLGPIPIDSGYREEGYFIWCGSLIRVAGTYHLFASRWPEGTGDPADSVSLLDGYRGHSQVVRAVADTPTGPYRFAEVVLPGRGGGHWDGQSCHGPKIVKVGDRYVLFYQGIARGSRLRKIGYAWADAVEGPWRRCRGEIPLTDDANNPAPYVHDDGSVLLAYRDMQLHMYVARADAFDGHYRTIARDIYPAGLLEDPDLHYHQGLYHMVVEDNGGQLTGSVRHGGHLVSADGARWEPHECPKVYTHTLQWDDGSATIATRRERPDLFNDADGHKGSGPPTHLITGVLAEDHAFCVVQPIGPAPGA